MQKFLFTASMMYFAGGLATVITGSVLPPLLLHYHLSYTVGGQLVFAQFIGFLLGVPAAATLLHRVGFKVLLSVAQLVVGLALCSIFVLPPIWVVATASVLTGLGVAAAETAAATMIMERFVGRRAVAMSYLEVGFGLGALVMPSVASLLIAHQSWRWSFLVAGTVAIATAIAWLLVPSALAPADDGPDPSMDAPASTQGWIRIDRRWLLGLFLLLIFLYVGLESSLSSFLPALFIPYLHVSASTASTSVSVLWLAMVLGRVATGWMVRKVSYPRFLFWSISGTLVFLMALTFDRTALPSYVSVFAIGLFMSGIYSITMVFANHALPGSPRLVTSLVTVFAGIGGAVLPAGVGYTMDHVAPAQVVWMLASLALLLLITLAVILVLSAMDRKHQADASTCAPSDAVY